MTANHTKPHWSDQIHLVKERLRHESQIIVASDFDGTLAEIVDHPQDATLHPAAALALRRLAKLYPRVQLAILSGRALSDLTQRIGIPDEHIIYAGNHGLEIHGSPLTWNHPAITTSQQDIHHLQATLEKKIHALHGAEIENKGASLTVHYRRCPPEARATLLDLLDHTEIPRSLRRHSGKMVVEYRPDVEWHKGYAMRALLGLLNIPEHAAVYLGDDVTDEDVFREFRTTGTTVQVGTTDRTVSARLCANDPADAAAFLNAVAEIF